MRNIKKLNFYKWTGVGADSYFSYYWISLYDLNTNDKIGVYYKKGELSLDFFSIVFLEKISLFGIPEDVRNSFIDFMKDPLFELEFERFKQKVLR